MKDNKQPNIVLTMERILHDLERRNMFWVGIFAMVFLIAGAVLIATAIIELIKEILVWCL